MTRDKDTLADDFGCDPVDVRPIETGTDDNDDTLASKGLSDEHVIVSTAAEAASSQKESAVDVANVAPPDPDSSLPKPEPKGTSVAVGLLLTFLSTFAFSVMALMVNLSSAALPAFELTSIRFFVQLLCSIATILVCRRGKLRNIQTWLGKPKNRRFMVFRACWGALGMSSYFFALSYPTARLADVTVLVFLNVPITAVLAKIILKEPYTKWDALTGVLCMVGVVLVAQPPAIFGGSEASQPTPPIVIIVSLFGAVTSAMAYISIRQIGKGEDTLVVVLYFSVLGSLVGPASSLVFGQPWIEPPSPSAWLMFFGVGITGFIGQLLLNKGVQSAPAGPATVMRYADVIFAIIFQATVFADPPNVLKWLGCLLVMSCMVAIYVKYKRSTQIAQPVATARSTESSS